MCKDCATFFVKTDDSQKKIVYNKSVTCRCFPKNTGLTVFLKQAYKAGEAQRTHR